jgi:hypothetical protein
MSDVFCPRFFSFFLFSSSISYDSGSKDYVSFYNCFRMICAFDHGSLVKDVVNRMEANNIDEK